MSGCIKMTIRQWLRRVHNTRQQLTHCMENQMDTQAEERRKPKPKSNNYGWYFFLLVVTALLLAGYFISTKKLYKAGDQIGHNMGWVGGFMMLTLFLYPLRKRARFMQKVGILPTWFKWHMIFGILGPALIMYHSTFHIGSVNAGVALVCMMLVSGSGIFGRFFYTKIHHGLYGRQASLQEIHAGMERSGDVQSTLSFAPEIQHDLEQFRAHATDPAKVDQLGLWNFLTVGTHTEWLYWSLSGKLKRIMRAKAREENWSAFQVGQSNRLRREHKKLIRAYLKAVRDVSQFHTYERLFSWWHIFHIPLVFMMVFSVIFHILSIYMY